MNIEVETQPNCLKTLRVDLPAEKVGEERRSIAEDFRRQARIPGYRPGKAPIPLIEKKFRKEIEDELKRKLVSSATREAIREKELKVLNVDEVEEVHFHDDLSMSFTARLITAPEFEMPEYKGLVVKVPDETVSEEEIDQTLENLRQQHADFEDVNDRPAQMGDFVVCDWQGTLDGKPLAEAVPESAAFFGDRTDFWLQLEEESFLPGFCSHFVGVSNGADLEFDLELPADFANPDLAGKTLHFTAKAKQIKERVLPEVNDELAGRIVPDADLAQVRELISEQLRNEKKTRIERLKNDQIIQQLLERFDCDLPGPYVAQESRRIAEDIVRGNQHRGASEDQIREREQEILAAADRGGRERVKNMFLLSRIATLEKIEAEPRERQARIEQLATRYGMKPAKLTEELRKRGTLNQIDEEIVFAKVLDFLKASATVEIVPESELSGGAEGAPATAPQS